MVDALADADANKLYKNSKGAPNDAPFLIENLFWCVKRRTIVMIQ